MSELAKYSGRNLLFLLIAEPSVRTTVPYFLSNTEPHSKSYKAAACVYCLYRTFDAGYFLQNVW
jgi:hypothetical protein